VWRGAAGAVALLVVATTTAAARSAPDRALGPADVRISDPAGDASGAPDLSSLTISNDHEGVVTFQLALIGGDPTASTSRFEIYLDADRDQRTGNAGSEYRWALAGRSWTFERWSGSVWEAASAQSGSADVAVAGNLGFVTFEIDVSELGGSRAFGVWARSVDTTTGVSDRVPDTGEANYALAAPTVRGVQVVVTPVHAVAFLLPGDTFSVNAATVELSDYSEAPAESFTCSAMLGRRPVPPKAPCRWRVPKTAGGKSIRIVVDATYQGGTYPDAWKVPVLRAKKGH
jgi:hypothetical protein